VKLKIASGTYVLIEKLAFFTQTTAGCCQKIDYNIGSGEKRQFFLRKLAKVAENRDHNIEPRPSVRVQCSISFVCA
jgi:hypothetical protein